MYNFDVARESTTYDVAYDFGSIMQYPNDAFSKKDAFGRPQITMLAKVSSSAEILSSASEIYKLSAESIFLCPKFE